jgi:YVTN family beta-propeller protein
MKRVLPTEAAPPKETDMIKRMVALLVLITLIAASHPAHAQSGAGQKLYVGLFKEDAVAVLDVGERRVVRRIAVPRGPHGLVITPDGRKVYVSSDGASTVSVIDAANDRVVGSIEVGPKPHGLAVSADGRQVLVSAWGANEALVIDTATDRVTARVAVTRAHNGAFTPDGRTAYVGSQQQGATALVVLDLTRGVEQARVSLDRTPRALDVSPDGRWLYFTVAGDDAVHVLETATNRIVSRISVGASPRHAPFTADGLRALVPSQGPGELAVVDVASRRVSGVISVGKTPHWVTASSDGRLGYVANEGSGDVSVVDIEARAVLATIAVGEAPRKIVLQPTPGRAAAQLPALVGPAVVDIQLEDYAFTPASVPARPGTALRLRLTNRASALHNITVPTQRIDRDIEPGSTIEVDVAVPDTGGVPFFCKFHGPLGQRGEVVLTRRFGDTR